jgi:hypothetical protein
LDIYLDLDDSFDVSEGDQYTGSLVACNGLNGLNGQIGATGARGPRGWAGPQGETGPQGEAGPAGPAGPEGPQGTPGATGPSGSGATIVVYDTNHCTYISGTSYYYVKGDNIYSHSSCHSFTKVANFNGSDETFWLSASKLAVDNNGDGIRVIDFN